MTLDLFSSIDFYLSKFSFLSLFTFVLSFSWVLAMMYTNTKFNRFLVSVLSLKVLLIQKFSKNLNKKVGSLLTLLTMFYVILGSNLLGLFPFAFGWTSHMLLILQVSLFLWGMINMSNMLYNMVHYTSHFTPQGVPLMLGLFLAKIELMSNMIRPLTLSLRLGMNITTGHVLLALMSVMGVSSNIFYMILFLLVMYFFFELFVMFMQAMVFSLLLSQYFEE